MTLRNHDTDIHLKPIIVPYFPHFSALLQQNHGFEYPCPSSEYVRKKQ